MKKYRSYNVFRRILSLILVAGLLGGATLGVLPAVAETGSAFDGWLTEGWTVKEENGEPMLVGSRSNSLNLLYSEEGVDEMYLEFDIYMEDSYSTVDGSIGPAYKMTNGYQYFCEYNTVSELVRIRRIGPGVDSHVGAAKSMKLELNQWYHFKVVLANDALQWYLNDQLLYTITDTKGDPLTGGRWCIQGYNATPRLRNLKMYNDLENAYGDWDASAWIKSAENGENVLTGLSNVAVNQLPTKEAVSNNALSLDIMMTDLRSEVDGNIGVSYVFADGQKYFFEYNPVYHFVRVRRIINGASSEVGKATDFVMNLNEWYNIKVIVSDNCIVWYVDDIMIHEIKDTYGDDLTSGIWTIQGYNSTPKLKNMKLYDADPSAAPEVENCDFEFISETSIGGFVPSKGTVSYGEGASDGALVYTLGGDGTSLQSPTIVAAVGTAYSARLDIKNTIFFRLKNDTDATQLRVYFKTSATKRYTVENSVLVDVTPHGDYESVYANLSACPDAMGYLLGFKVEPTGVSDGTVTFDAISFEREKAFYDYAGKIVSCLADDADVTVKGTLDEPYAGKTVHLYELAVSNWSESVEGLTPVATVTADGTSFEMTVPLMGNKVSRLSSLFMVTVDGVKVSDRFQIENYRDFTENPYAFTLSDYSVKVTDKQFGAVGDAFTDDTAAIQAAIEHVSAQGGGTVIVPGDDSYYGRRYIVTNIKMKDNVELRIETGAVLWQSPRVSDYTYDIVYGHDVSIPGVNWTHAASCHNYPMIQGDNVKNIRITGGGSLRSVDTGSENLDSVSGSSIWTGCENRLHIIPIGLWQCENIEISDITLLRTNNYHVNLRDCDYAYVANITAREVTCASGDGVSCTIGTKHVLIDRFTFYSNDDAVTLCSTYNDPRGLVWWHANPGGDNCIEDITITHSHIFGGHGITFITWGTDAPDISLQEIKDIEVYDCVLTGSYSVGAWPDNPYYGKTFDNTETNDFSPVKNIRIHDNDYKSTCTLECIQGTDMITDCGIHSASSFVNGSFERKNGKTGWTSGLSNWLWTEGEGSRVESVEVGEGHMGKITGTGSLYEGLYLGVGEHSFTVDTNLVSGTGRLFVRHSITDETVMTLNIPRGETKALELTFTLAIPSDLYIGAELTQAGELYIDNADMNSTQVTYPDTFHETFEKLVAPTFDFSGWNTVTEDGNTYIEKEGGSSGNTPYRLELDDKTDAFDLRYHVRVSEVLSTVDGNIGISFCRVDSNTQYFVEYNTVGKYLLLRRFQSGAAAVLFKKDYTLNTGEWYQFGLSYENGTMVFYINGERLVEYTDDKPLDAAILTLTGYNTAIGLDNITLAEYDSLDMTEKLPLKAEVYALVYNTAGGSPTPSAQVLKAGDAVTVPAIPTREGYTFEGWMLDGEMVDLTTFIMPAADVALTAKWMEVAVATEPVTEPATEPITKPETEPIIEPATEPDDTSVAGSDTEDEPVTSTPGSATLETDAVVTTAMVTAEATATETTVGDAADTTLPAEDEGCSSVIAAGTSLSALLLLAGAAVTVRKRKDT